MKMAYIVAVFSLVGGVVESSIAFAKDEPAKVAPADPPAEKRPETSATEPRVKEVLKWDQLDSKAAERAAEKQRAKRPLPPSVPADK